ncbi:heavy-metal-associated domain-containing protein [Sedimenticola selenatireducens]|uniref:heavy-metal-associated domain-containing protein n=1 Tax=Sedimenticola selenatireducens TaxID=191960 RepID=UPI0004B06394|nr:heavy-metal-associated domain-containing protein [Sedimenticola selenatireducens]
MKTSNTMKFEGAWDVNRRINIPALVHAADGMAIERVVNALSGVHEVTINVEKHLVVVHYDASKSDYQEILELLENTGFPPSDNWWSRVKCNWYQFSDTNAKDNAKAPPPACCNKPPK